MCIAIGRPIEGISLNGNEWLLNDDDTLMEFDSIKKAKEFLVENGADPGDTLEDCFVYKNVNEVQRGG